MYGLSENVIIFDLGPIGQGQIQGQILIKNCKFENIIFSNMEGIDRLIPKFFYTMLRYLWDYIPMIMCLDLMTLASCPFDLDQNRALKN